MIRFDADARIAYMSCPLVELLTAAALFSSLARIDLVFSRIHDPAIPAGTLHGFTLAAGVATEGSRPDDLRRLHGWFERQLAPPWLFDLAADHVRAEWDVSRISAVRDGAAAAAR